MYFTRAILLCALAGFAVAQSSVASESELALSTAVTLPASTGTPSAVGEGMVTTHIVSVGGPNGSLAFYPDNISAQPGDMVQFQFYAKVQPSSLPRPTNSRPNTNDNRTTPSSNPPSITPAYPSKTSRATRPTPFILALCPQTLLSARQARSSRTLFVFQMRSPCGSTAHRVCIARRAWWELSTRKSTLASPFSPYFQSSSLYEYLLTLTTVPPKATRQCRHSPPSPPKLAKTSPPVNQAVDQETHLYLPLLVAALLQAAPVPRNRGLALQVRRVMVHKKHRVRRQGPWLDLEPWSRPCLLHFCRCDGLA